MLYSGVLTFHKKTCVLELVLILYSLFRQYLEIEHPLLLVFGTEARLQSWEAAARLLPTRRHLAARTLHVHHVIQFVQPATPADTIPIVTVAMKHRRAFITERAHVVQQERGGGGRLH